MKWIPVTERVPDHGYPVLATVLARDGKTRHTEIAEYSPFRGWRVFDGVAFDSDEPVIAWKPLPEPWEGE